MKKEKIIDSIKALNVPGVVVDESTKAEDLTALHKLLTSGASIAKLEEEKAALETKVADLTKDVDTKDQQILEVNAELQKTQETLKENKITNPVITIGSDKFKIVSGGHLRNTEGDVKFYSIDEIAKDKELQKELVKTKSGLLEPIK